MTHGTERQPVAPAITTLLEAKQHLLNPAPILAVNGSRMPSQASRAAATIFLMGFLPPAVRVVVGSALRDHSGIDALAREHMLTLEGGRDRLQVERAQGTDARSLIERSQRVAVAVATQAGAPGVLVSFPDQPCPASITPQPLWVSGRPHVSGTWSTAGLAVGLGAGLLVFLATPTSEERAHLVGAWQLTELPGGWWVRQPGGAR